MDHHLNALKRRNLTGPRAVHKTNIAMVEFMGVFKWELRMLLQGCSYDQRRVVNTTYESNKGTTKRTI